MPNPWHVVLPLVLMLAPAAEAEGVVVEAVPAEERDPEQTGDADNAPAIDRAEVYAGLDALELADFATVRPGRVVVGSRTVDGEEQPVHLHGLLVAGDDGPTALLRYDLGRHPLVDEEPEAGPRRRGYQPQVDESPLAGEASEEPWGDLIGRWESVLENHHQLRRLRYRRTIDVETELAIAARVAAARGERASEDRLWELVHQLVDDGHDTFSDRLTADLATAAMWRLVLAMGDPDRDRASLAERLATHLDRFPDTPHRDQAVQLQADLATTIAAAADAPTDPDLDALPQPRRIALLIGRLAAMEGRFYRRRNRFNLGVDLPQPPAATPANAAEDDEGEPPPGEPDAAALLVEEGLAAVPALIAAIDDRRLTRTVGYRRPNRFSHHVVRVGDYALAVLQAIAGRRFEHHPHAVRLGQTEKVTAEIRAWWEAVDQRGFPAVLAEGVRLGDGDSTSQAQRLLTRDRELAVAAIADALTVVANANTHQNLVDLLADPTLPGAERVLADHFAEAMTPDLQAVIGKALLHHERYDILPRLVRAWRASRAMTPRLRRGRHHHRLLLTCLLVRCGGTDELATLREELPECATGVRFIAAAALHPTMAQTRYEHTSLPRLDDAGRPELRRARLLLAEQLLGDDEVNANHRLRHSDGTTVLDPSVAERAAMSVTHDRDDEPIDWTMGPPTRRVQLAVLRNRIRAELGLEPLPPPDAWQVEAVDPELVDELIADLLACDPQDEDARAIARAQLTGLGLGAVGTINRRLEDDGALDQHQREDLRQVAGDLARIVRRVRIEGDPSPLARNLIEDLEHRYLDTSHLLATWNHLRTQPRALVRRMELRIESDGDGLGLEITAEITGAEEPLPTNHRYHLQVRHGAANKGRIGGSGDPATNQRSVKLLDDSLEAAGEVPVGIQLWLVHRG